MNINTLTQPTYFYRVYECRSTFAADLDKTQPFSKIWDFKGKDLQKCKSDALAFYNERLSNFYDNPSFKLPYAAPGDFVMGENSTFSLDLLLVEYFSEDEYDENSLIGDADDEEIIENRELEKYVLDNWSSE